MAAVGGGGNIKVVVRVRPFNGREKDRNAQCIVHMKDTQTVLTPPSNIDSKSKNAKAAVEGKKTFAFDKSYWSFDRNDKHFAGQDDLFNDLGKPLLDNAFGGYNNCIFAYGQTGSGKSYSMMGYGEEAGVIPKICRSMFDRITEMEQDKTLSSTVEVSYLEIYNERVRDLLNPSNKGNLKVREHPSTGPYVEDLAKLVVRSFQEIENLMDEGNKARTVAATNMNETSSRSHAVFTLTLTQKRHDVETNMDSEKVAKISLVDLAGSERATSTGATGARLKEGAEINRSLSTLGRVIAALADLSTGKNKKANMVPYRDSVLTWLLKDSLGGNSMTAMIAAISPADINFDETLSTLRYADSAKRIKNHAVVNEDPNARMIRELKEELAQLRSKLTGGGGGAGMSEEPQYAPDTPLEKQIVSITQADGTVKKVSKAEIAEQLNQSEKLYKDLNQTWEEKLQKTEEIHKEREQALEDLGITIEKGSIGLSTPKKMPHLVNLSDDPLLAECLIYNLKPGTTTVGSESASNVEIRLNGSKILQDHCSFENVDGVVTVVPKDNAAVMVNGQRIEKPKRLRSGFRIILGDFHIFRFNHPQEARAERAEQGSLLRHSITASQIDSPSPRPLHERTTSTVSRPDSDNDSASPRPSSPTRNGRDTDWSFARREAVTAILGDQKMSNLTDEELDVLFDDLQRVRAVRKARPESRLFGNDIEDDTDSVTSYPIREKYASNGTLDNFSLDTALTVPSTPRLGDEDERLKIVREDMQQQLDKQKDDYNTKLQEAEDGPTEIAEIRAEKIQMEDNLRELKVQMQQELQAQKEAFEEQIKTLTNGKEVELSTGTDPATGSAEPTEKEIHLAKKVLDRWRQRRYVAMAGIIMQKASTLKEAQIMSQQMDKNVVFQFCIIDKGHHIASSYDLVLNGEPYEDDEDLEFTPKPCVGVRVVDFAKNVIYLWSLQKLDRRVRLMRQMHQYLDRPEYLQHFKLENPFTESCQPEFSRIGEADVPLVAVFESRVQDCTLDVISPFTSNVIGIIKLSLEPSSAEAPSSTLKFNVVMHELVGFPEREGTDIHAQLFVPGISEEGGGTTTQMISGFDEDPIRFESVHSMSLPLSSPRDSALRISIFAKATPMHLDMLLSWDDMRDSAPPSRQKKRSARIAESEFYSEEVHDIFARIQIHEISEDGTYQPTEVVQHSAEDAGAYQLHQGLQRRVVVNLVHSSGEMLKWQDITSIRIGKVRLLDHQGKSPSLDEPQEDIPIKLVSPPTVKENADGTNNVTFVGHWDSSMHGSLLLDRVTSEKYRVQVSLSWSAICTKLSRPMIFSHDIGLQMRSRTYVRPSNFFQQFMNPTRIVHSTVGIFSVTIRPTSVQSTTDMWRLNTQYEVITGEELLNGWTPRGVSLVRDFIAIQKRRRRIAEIETARSVLSSRSLTIETSTDNSRVGSPFSISTEDEFNGVQKQLLSRVLGLWQTVPDSAEQILQPANLEPPAEGAAFAPRPRTSSTSTAKPKLPSLIASVRNVPKNPALLKGGYLLTPDPNHTRWVRRFAELRKPYLHIYSVPEGDEVHAINLSNARVDHQPQVARLLNLGGKRNGGHGDSLGSSGGGTVFAIWARENAWIFKTRTEAEKIEWILRIDQSYFTSGTNTPDG
ncbi:kinesin-domain-containing protein [Pseudovirgaria hyperparasitica]|uniref:Kinesin-domain-containing protein n=1 Tax=Pseudovirgaria hyperparasitica TaxID=470096 RepID=A0A6A6W3X6_9PEZI|nr:kinesin-domain-containing protein [Pseudovirgaria hyperparasitica]KAF2756650.1 kinesin-domain-containing protein [Pseudovirgaria hyperparasitica]